MGQDTRRLIEMLGRDALSRRYMTRDFMPAEAGADAYRLTGNVRDEFVGRARRIYERSMERMRREPAAFYLAGAYPRRNRLPLVQPWRMTYRATPGRDDPERFPLVRLLERLLADTLLDTMFHNMDQQDRQLFVLPNSLLIRLLVHSVEVHMQWVHGAPAIDPGQRVLRRHEEAALLLAKELDREEWWADGKHPVSGARLFLLNMPDETRTQWERALRATLDTGAHRIDPWVSGFAWQRLTQHSASPRHAHRLGVYGWLDGPFIGKPGPTEAGRLHAPSHAQALASLVLRDKYLSSGRELAGPGVRNPWQMDIDSQKTRVAEEIADEVRLGFNIHEITGRRIENIVGNHQKVKALRTSERYAMRPERKDLNEVCDGIRALRGLLAGDPEAIVTETDLRLDQPALPAGDPQFPLSDDQRLQLKLLHLSLDTYGDLLMADGALQIVNRQIERAAESMDAAAGFFAPAHV